MSRLRSQQAKDRLSAKAAAIEALPGGEAVEKIQEIQKGVKRLQNMYRVINGASAVTLWGIILTFLTLNAQLIFGNLLKARFIPPLSLPEIFVTLVLDFLVLASLTWSLIMILVLIAVAGVAKELLEELGIAGFDEIIKLIKKLIK